MGKDKKTQRERKKGGGGWRRGGNRKGRGGGGEVADRKGGGEGEAEVDWCLTSPGSASRKHNRPDSPMSATLSWHLYKVHKLG